MSTPATVPALTLAVSHEGLGDFFTALVAFFAAKEGGLPMGTINGLIDGGDFGDGDYNLDGVNVSGGHMANPDLTVVSVAPRTPGVSDGTFTVTVNLSGHVTYDDWYEWGSFTSSQGGSGVVHVDPFSATYGGFAFDISAMPMTLNVTISAGQDETDPDDTALVLRADVSDVSYGTASIANVSAPSGSVINVGSFFNLIKSQGIEQLSAALTSQNMIGPFVAALNVMFKIVGDSGVIAPNLAFLFPPTEIVYPPSGGFQMGVSGQFISNGARYTATDPTPLALPDVPQSGMTFALNEYLLDEALWGASMLGALDLSLPLPGSPPEEWNTLQLQSSCPNLFNFAPGLPFTVSISNAPEQSPRFTFMPAWQATEAVLQQVGAPASVVTALTNPASPVVSMIFASAELLTAVLRGELSEADFSAWSGPIVTAAQGFGLSTVAVYTIAFHVPVHGVSTQAVWFQTALTHWVDGLGITSNADNTAQACVFTLNRLQAQVGDVNGIPQVPFSQADAQNLFNQVVEPQLNTLTAALQAVGARGVALPCAPNFVLRQPQLTVTGTRILISGDTTSAG